MADNSLVLPPPEKEKEVKVDPKVESKPDFKKFSLREKLIYHTQKYQNIINTVRKAAILKLDDYCVSIIANSLETYAQTHEVPCVSIDVFETFISHENTQGKFKEICIGMNPEYTNVVKIAKEESIALIELVVNKLVLIGKLDVTIAPGGIAIIIKW